MNPVSEIHVNPLLYCIVCNLCNILLVSIHGCSLEDLCLFGLVST